MSSKRAAPLRICYGQPLTNQISGWDWIQSDQIQLRSNQRSNLAVDCHNLLTLLKRVRGSGEIFQLYGKNQNRSGGPTDLPFLASQKLILASQQGYLSDFKQIWFNLFPYFQGTIIPFALPINSPPGAKGGGKKKNAHAKRKRERTPQAETSSRRTARTRIQRLLENCFSIQRADTLTPSSQGISGTRRERIPNWTRFWEVARGFYQPSVLWFSEPGEKGISSLASSKGQSGRALTRLLSAHFSRISEEIYL